ncbi:MAG: DUF6268 family outer membrane beta-barrel protein [Myxococcota bacterium]
MNAAVRAARSHPTCSFVALALLAFVPGTAPAQETRQYDLPDLEQEVREERSLKDLVSVRFKASNRFVGLADFGEYKADSYQPEGRLKVTVPVARNAGIRLMGTGRALLYDFEDGADLGLLGGSEKPFDDLYGWNLRLQGAYLFDPDQTLFSPRERWSLLGETFVRANWEKGRQMSEALRSGVTLAAGYRYGKDLELAAGVSVRGTLWKGQVRVWPVLEFDWRINEQWKLSSQGLGLQLERRFGERITAFARARWENSVYRLADRGAEIGKANLRIRQVPAGLGLWWNVNRHVRVTTLGGVMALHELRVKSSGGRTLDTDSARPSPYFLIRFDLRS